jgi:hypothetical protein
MGGVYGNHMLAFPEQFINCAYFDQAALPDSGYGPETGGETVRGVLQCTLGRRVETRNGNLVRERKMAFWTTHRLVVGKFLRLPASEGAHVYRIKGSNDWRREAGFTEYALERVVGADGDENVDTVPNVGTGSFS